MLRGLRSKEAVPHRGLIHNDSRHGSVMKECRYSRAWRIRWLEESLLIA